MRNLFASLSLKSSLLLGFLLSVSTAFGQTFLTAVGYPLPTDERGPSGVITNSGDYLALGTNYQHPHGFFNANGDAQLVWLNATGNVIQPSKILGQDVGESGVWIEKSVDCNGLPGYIVAGNEQAGPSRNILLTQTDLAGNPLWVRRFGTAVDDESSACVKQDGAGNFILIGTRVPASGGPSEVYAAKLDCSGKPQWIRTYTVNGNLTAASVTVFATEQSPCLALPPVYYVTGTLSVPGSPDEVFILSIDAATGGMVWMKSYDVAPGAHDLGTCIQGSCTLDPALDGDLWVYGYSLDPNTGDKQLLVLRTNFDGTLLWANNYDILNSKQEFSTHFQFNGKGELVLTGKAEEYAVSDPPETGQCFLMKMDNNGGLVHWTHVYTLGYASQGNRVEPTAADDYFVVGHTYEIIQPHAFDYNILAIKTDGQGRIQGTCFHNPFTEVIHQNPKVTPLGPLVAPRQDFSFAQLLVKPYDDKQTFCPSDPCQNINVNANFSVSVSGNTVTFTDLSTVGSGTIFTWDWDYGDANTASFNIATNPVHTYTNPGAYVVCLVVTAGTAGMVCRDTFCVDVIVEPTHETCPDNLVQNGDFTGGLIAGNLGFGGALNNWTTLFNTPQVITHDSCAEFGAVQMWGNQVVGEGIVQPVNFTAGFMYEVTFCGLWMPTVQDSVRIRFRASTSPLTNYFNCTSGTCDQIFLSPVLATAWGTYTSAIWVPTQNYSFLNITVWNNFAVNDGAYVSWSRIDDICIRNLGPATTAAPETAAADLSLRVFPNPTDGDLTLEFDRELPADAQLIVTDLVGRRLQLHTLDAGQTRAALSLRDHPAGVYLVQVIGEDSVWCTRKVVKQ